LAQGQDGRTLEHVQQCENCGRWLQEQRKLAASLQMLQTRTAALEAGPKVEDAVLRAFRHNVGERADVAGTSPAASLLAKSEERRAKSELPFALRLSRWFEVGAYVAVAAAVVVGLFLGVRLLQHRSRPVAVQSQTSPENTKPLVKPSEAAVGGAVARNGAEKPVAAAPEVIAKADAAPASQPRTAIARNRLAPVRPARSGNNQIAAAGLANEESQLDTDAGYVPLMFCDPLSCASGSQVVRMELPAGPSSQPQTADVVVGYDGVVRAVRIVN
jgi:negative regulator of sigma E activity